MPKDGNTRDGRATRIPAEPEVEQVITLLDSDVTTRGQRDFINHTLRDLSDETGVRLPRPEADLRDFYLEAAYSIGAANPRWRMREILKLIAGGERFYDYKKGDPFYIWRDKRKQRNHSLTKNLAEEVEKRITDPRTPTDYRAALKRALRAYCEASGSKYDATRPAWTYTEAEAEGEGFSTASEGWHAHRDSRGNILNLLEGLRKRRPLASVEVRGASATERSGAEPPATGKVKPKALPRGPSEMTIREDMGHVGFVRGDIVSVKRIEDLKPRDICGVVEKAGDDLMYIGRVVACSHQSLTYQGEDGTEWTPPRSEITELWHIEPEPVGKDDGLTDDARALLKKLNDRLDALGNEDDQIIRCTARYKLEKEIYDIEHPIGGDIDDWNEWEEDDE